MPLQLTILQLITIIKPNDNKEFNTDGILYLISNAPLFVITDNFDN